LIWNLTHLPKTMSSRRAVLKLGESYSDKILNHHAANDITVIIPCHNYENYVGEAIESVLSQTLKPSRIIVIDDGSTDDSRRVIKRYEKDGVELIEQPNSG